MKQELRTQYLTLKLKIGQMLARLNETEGTIKQLEKDLAKANAEIAEKTKQLADANAKAKEYFSKLLEVDPDNKNAQDEIKKLSK